MNCSSHLILSNLLMKFLAINIKLFGVLWQNKNKNLLVVYHREVFVFIWITTRSFLLLFEKFNQFHALWFDEFFSLVENKIVKIKRKKWSKLSFFISKLLRMPLPGSWKTGNGSANHSYSYGHDCTCGWQNPFLVFQLPGKDT